MKNSATSKRAVGRSIGRGPGIVRPATLAVLVVAASLIALGLLQGDYLAVLSRAVRICYECIGIG